MDVRTASRKAAKDIIKALNVLTYSPSITAQILTGAPGPIQHRLYLTVRAVIKIWAIEGRARTFDPQYQEIYDWAREIDSE